MAVQITKTAAQAKKENALRDKDRTCPECGEISFIGTVTTDLGGLFRKIRKKNNYSCRCGCEWETDWR